jgi:hypothetical protein
MKAIPVSLLLTGLFIPVMAHAQPEPPEMEAGGEDRGPRPDGPDRGWRQADKDGDRKISRAEYDAMPRIQSLPVEKRDMIFKRLDKNEDGFLDPREFGPMGRRREGGPPMRRIWELDTDKSGGVSLEEFRLGELFKKLPPEKLEEIFHRLDTDGDGQITPKDRPEPPPRRGPGGPGQMIRDFDTNADGAVTFEEFRKAPAIEKLSEDQQEDRFEKMDRNHDHKIDAQDFPPPPEGKPGEGEPENPEPPDEPQPD